MMQNLTFFDYQINEYGQNTLKTPKNIALHMKHQKHQKYKNHNNHNNRPLTCRKHSANIPQTCRKRVSIMSENNAKNHYTDPENDIFYLYTYTHAHTTTEWL